MALYLILEVQGGAELEVGDPPRKVFDVTGGRIGRELDCEWVLSSRFLSRHHATISHADGVFFIESVGTNGVAVNDPKARMPRHARCALLSGDRLFVDDYEIGVTVADDAKQSVNCDDSRPVRLPSWDPLEPGQNDRVAGILPLARVGRLQSPASSANTMPQEREATEATGLTNPLRQREVWGELVSPPAGQRAAAASRIPPEIAATDAHFDVAAFLKGAGLAQQDVPAGQAALLGQIVRSVVQGIIDVLRERAVFRSQVHLARASSQPSPENPLRVAGEAENAVAALLRPAAPGNLSPLEALEDALDELRCHQLAMLAGMHSGFRTVNRCFDPQNLVEECDRSHARGLAHFGAKARYWDRYVDLFKEVVVHPDGALRRHYEEAFSEAYERQLEDLKRMRGRLSRV